MEELDRQLTYIVGVSGGCDSMYLLDHLYRNHYSIVVCHVDYGIRHDTDEDYNVVFNYTQKNHIPFFFKKVQQYEPGNFQNIARNIRYDFFLEIGKQFHTNHVVVAHHQDDVYETILLQKERDTKYLYLGLKRESEVRGNIVHRVLLDTTKQEIIDYCKQNNLAYHDDYTNFETHYHRDYIRNCILNQMSDIEKAKLLEEAKKHNQELEERKEKVQSYLTPVLDLRRIEKNNLEDVLYYFLERKIHRISASLLDEIVSCVQKEGNKQIDLPGHNVFIKEYHNAYIQPKEIIEDYEYTLDSLKEMTYPTCKVALAGHPYDGVGLTSEDFPVTIRNFRPGDRIFTKVGYKKVNRVFIDRKIPASLRKTWPIIVNAKGEIVLIPHIMKNFNYFHIHENVFVVEY